jgi:hypothetical protein
MNPELRQLPRTLSHRQSTGDPLAKVTGGLKEGTPWS